MSIKHKIILQLKKMIHILGFTNIQTSNEVIKKIAIENYLEKKINELKINNPSDLCCFEYQAFSQNGEDGIIREIFDRVGLTNKYFVEFGVGDGTENNTGYLLLNGWGI